MAERLQNSSMQSVAEILKHSIPSSQALAKSTPEGNISIPLLVARIINEDRLKLQDSQPMTGGSPLNFRKRLLPLDLR